MKLIGICQAIYLRHNSRAMLCARRPIRIDFHYKATLKVKNAASFIDILFRLINKLESIYVRRLPARR